ncbi:MAG: flavocytochrome c [Desulfuromonas sp.]|nr:MAG: flavocytochrome c [Desulfuromonas sp.]
MKEEKGHQVDRRKFLVGMGIAGAAATATLASPVLAAAGDRCETKWDQEHEVVIIGSGFAGLAAAIQAKRLGAKDVVIFEKMAVFGGNSAFNGGMFAVPESPLQKKEGIKDSPEAMAADQAKAGRGIANKEQLLHVAKRAKEALQMTLDAGSEYFPYLQQLGGHSVPRTYQTTNAVGAGITQPLLNECKKLGVRLVNRAMFNSLIFDDKGKVVGAKIREGYYFGRGKEGSPINVRSQRGVLVATGGFARNVGLRSAQDPTLTAEVGSTNPPNATGEGLLELFHVGAVPVHMAHIQTGPWASADEDGFGYVSNYSIYNFAHSISVYPKTGRRFMNEIADRKTRSDAQLQCRDDTGNPLPPVTITSYEHAKEHPTMKKVLKYGVGWKFDSVEELAKHHNIPLKALKEQIEEYNGYVKKGVDEQFGKPMAKAKGKYLKAPFVTVRNWPKVHYCQGGALTDVNARVIDSTTWKPIPGLYAAGEVAGGMHGVSRLGSCSIPDCMVMGMTAAETMMKS